MEWGSWAEGPAERTASVDPLNLIQVMLAEGGVWKALGSMSRFWPRPR